MKKKKQKEMSENDKKSSKKRKNDDNEKDENEKKKKNDRDTNTEPAVKQENQDKPTIKKEKVEPAVKQENQDKPTIKKEPETKLESDGSPNEDGVDVYIHDFSSLAKSEKNGGLALNINDFVIYGNKFCLVNKISEQKIQVRDSKNNTREVTRDQLYLYLAIEDMLQKYQDISLDEIFFVNRMELLLKKKKEKQIYLKKGTKEFDDAIEKKKII